MSLTGFKCPQCSGDCWSTGRPIDEPWTYHCDGHSRHGRNAEGCGWKGSKEEFEAQCTQALDPEAAS